MFAFLFVFVSFAAHKCGFCLFISFEINSFLLFIESIYKNAQNFDMLDFHLMPPVHTQSLEDDLH